jgi:hypothetical protein
MKHREEFEKSLLQLGKGFNLILESISNFSNEEELETVLDVFNGQGKDKEGYSQNRYAHLFSKSFDEEVANYEIFIEEFLNKTIEIDALNKTGNVHNALKGFELSLEALETLHIVLQKSSELKKELISFKGELTNNNPFSEYGIFEFKKRFKGWSRAFHKELKDELGRRSLEKYKNLSNKLVDSKI